MYIQSTCTAIADQVVCISHRTIGQNEVRSQCIDYHENDARHMPRVNGFVQSGRIAEKQRVKCLFCQLRKIISRSRTYGTVSMKSGKSSSDARPSLLCERGKKPCINRMAPNTNDKIDQHKIQAFLNFIIFIPGHCPLGLSPSPNFFLE